MNIRWNAALLVFSLGFTLSLPAQATPTLRGKHAAMNLACDVCHGQVKPREIPEEEVCLKCHGSRNAIAAKTATRKPNPHYGHDDSVSCMDCHKSHEPSVLTCDQCHQFGFKTP